MNESAVSNESRANKAEHALYHYATDSWFDEPRTALLDLLSDLRHLAQREGWDFSQCVLTSEIHFNSEAE